MHIEFKDEPTPSIDAFTGELKTFSEEFKINFMIRRFLSDELTVIYLSNLANDQRFITFNNVLMDDESFISSRNTNDINQVGLLKKYLSDSELRIYDIEGIRHSGLVNDIYIYGYHEALASKLTERFTKFGEITLQHNKISFGQILSRQRVTSDSLTFLLLLIILVILYAFATFQFINGNSKWIDICKLSGLSATQIIGKTANLLIHIGMLIADGLALIVYICVLIISKITLLAEYGHFIVVFFILIVSLVFVFQLVLATAVTLLKFGIKRILIYKSKRKSSLILTVIKTTAIILLFLSATNLYENFKKYETQNISMEKWIDNKDMFKPILSSEVLKYRDDLANERVFNDKCSLFYERLKNENNAFIIKSSNFYRVKEDSKIGTEDRYFYQQFVSSNVEELSPYGNAIEVDESYLSRNPIETIDNRNALDVLVYSPDTLNLLVPVTFKSEELIIYRNYINYFHFQKVDVANIYNQALENPKNLQDKASLNIHIIYVKDNQAYFTYSSLTGDIQGNVVDPIAMVYNPSMDTSHMMSLLSSSVFFESQNNTSAYFDIFPLIDEIGLSEIKSVRSVYSEVGEQIKSFKYSLITNFLILLFSLILFLYTITQYIFLYYEVHQKKYTIKYLNGLSLISLHLILTSLISNGITLIVLLSVLGSEALSLQLLLLVISAFILFESLFGFILVQYSTKLNACSIVKGVS